METAFPLVNWDDLPGITDHPDRGCRFHPRCLTCPYDPCILEIKGGAFEYINSLRRAGQLTRINELRAQGMTLTKVAEVAGMSRRQVLRILARARAH